MILFFLFVIGIAHLLGSMADGDDE